MSKSDPTSLLSGPVLSVFTFLLLWVVFSYGLAVTLLFWGHFFHPRWYENTVVIGGGAVLAWATLRTVLRWITSRHKHE